MFVLIPYTFSVCFYQLLTKVAVSSTQIQSSSPMNLLPSAASVINMADSQERALFANIMHIKEEAMDVELVDPTADVNEVIGCLHAARVNFFKVDGTLYL
jgi:hypothetical protein